MDIDNLLRAATKHHPSDLHLQADSPPILRVNGELTPINAPALTAEDISEVVHQVASEEALASLERDHSIDISYLVPEVQRFRINIYYEKNRLCAAFRFIPLTVPGFGELNLPPVIEEIAAAERGLVLVTGTTGSGKSTTLAAVINTLNETRRLRIITVEDPIEFVHISKKSLVAQREVGPDTPGFLEALRRAVRQDPDVILVGELRDLETIKTAFLAADTGHMVYSTVHTANAMQTVQRIIAMFPPNERELLITQLSMNLRGIISQRLAQTIDGKGRVPVVEILRNSPVIRKLLLESRATALPQAMANREQGMQLFDQHVVELFKAQRIGQAETLRHATNREAVALAMRGISSGDTGAGLVR